MLDLEEETRLEIKMSLVKEMGRFILEMDILQRIKDITLQRARELISTSSNHQVENSITVSLIVTAMIPEIIGSWTISAENNNHISKIYQ